MRARELAVGRVPCLAVRVTYVGELGWELYCPAEFGLALWDTIWEAGRRARARRRRLQGDRLAPAREGLPRVGRRHHARGHAVRGGARLRREARQGRLRRSRRARRAPASPSGALLPHARRSACGRARLGAGPRRRRARRPGDERRVRLHGRALDRVRLSPAARGVGTAVEVEIFGEWVAGDVAAEPLYDPRASGSGRRARERPWSASGPVAAPRDSRGRDHEPQLQGRLDGEPTSSGSPVRTRRSSGSTARSS